MEAEPAGGGGWIPHLGHKDAPFPQVKGGGVLPEGLIACFGGGESGALAAPSVSQIPAAQNIQDADFPRGPVVRALLTAGSPGSVPESGTRSHRLRGVPLPPKIPRC